MKNKYEIRGETTAIFCHKKGICYEALIDTEDLPIAQMLRGTWALQSITSKRSFYVVANVWDWPNKRQVTIRLHRKIMSPDKDVVVDHINHDSLDNRKSNLRIITKGENGQNSYGNKSNKSSGIRGVHWCASHGKWRATVQSTLFISGKKKTVLVGSFDDVNEAERAVKRARAKLLPGSYEAWEASKKLES